MTSIFLRLIVIIPAFGATRAMKPLALETIEIAFFVGCWASSCLSALSIRSKAIGAAGVQTDGVQVRSDQKPLNALRSADKFWSRTARDCRVSVTEYHVD